MNELANITNDDTLTMSSREIAELCEKRHPDVKRDIETMFSDLNFNVSNFAHIYLDTRNREQTEYLLPKDLTITLITGYRADLRFKVVKRLEEYEAVGVRPVASPREVRLSLKDNLAFGKLMGLTGNQLAIAANQATRAMTSFDVMAAMNVTHLVAPQNEQLLTPSSIGKRLGGVSPQSVNALLAENGFQERFRDSQDRPYYEPTSKGRNLGAQMQDTGKRHSNGTPVRQLKWPSSTVDVLETIMTGSEPA